MQLVAPPQLFASSASQFPTSYQGCRDSAAKAGAMGRTGRHMVHMVSSARVAFKGACDAANASSPATHALPTPPQLSALPRAHPSPYIVPTPS